MKSHQSIRGFSLKAFSLLSLSLCPSWRRIWKTKPSQSRSILNHIYLLSCVRWGLSQRTMNMSECMRCSPEAEAWVSLVTTPTWMKRGFNLCHSWYISDVTLKMGRWVTISEWHWSSAQWVCFSSTTPQVQIGNITLHFTLRVKAIRNTLVRRITLKFWFSIDFTC